MSGDVSTRAPKRVCTEERANVSKNEACAQAAQALTPDWSGLSAELISKIGLQLNKQDASRLMCVCCAFNTVIGKSGQIKRPLTAIRAEFKTDVRDLKPIDEIPEYMYEGVKELIGHRNWVTSVIQLKDLLIG